MDPRLEKQLRLGLLIISVVGSLVALEGGLRLTGMVTYRPFVPGQNDGARDKMIHIASDNPNLLYTLAPNRTRHREDGTTVTINAVGLRDAPRTMEKAPDQFRIAAVGDSFTFGLGVDDHETWPRVLDTLVGENTEVLNFGMVGYSLEQEAELIDVKVQGFDPDVVVVAYVLNDPETEPVQPLTAIFRKPAWWEHSHLLRHLAGMRRDRRLKRYGAPNWDYYRFLHQDPQRWAPVPKALKRIRATLPETPLVLAVFPMPRISQGWAAYPYADVHQMVVDAGREAGFDQVIDLQPALSKHPVADIALTEKDNHPTALGHRVAAQAIHQRLVKCCGVSSKPVPAALPDSQPQ